MAAATSWTKTQLRGNALHRGRGCVLIQFHSSAQESIGIEVAEHDAGVSERGVRSAASVAGGAGLGPCAARPYLEETPGIDPGDGSTAGSKAFNVHG